MFLLGYVSILPSNAISAYVCVPCHGLESGPVPAPALCPIESLVSVVHFFIF